MKLILVNLLDSVVTRAQQNSQKDFVPLPLEALDPSGFLSFPFFFLN